MRGSPDVVPLHVLIVDDDELYRASLKRTLSALGCDVDTASDGAAAWRFVRSRVPDLLFMDIAMPAMDGLEATRRIRALQSGKRAHIVVCSALEDARSRELAFEAGCDQFLVKPFSIEGVVRAFVERHHHLAFAAPVAPAAPKV